MNRTAGDCGKRGRRRARNFFSAPSKVRPKSVERKLQEGACRQDARPDIAAHLLEGTRTDFVFPDFVDNFEIHASSADRIELSHAAVAT